MSTPQAVAAVTAILFDEVRKALPEYAGAVDLVTAGHPQVARGDRTDPQVNLFLYQITPDGAWRNQDTPGRAGAAYPLLALRLGYLVTAYGQEDDDRQAHDLLGAVMLRFHANPVLDRRNASDPVIAASELARQYEPVRLTLQPLTLDDLSKVWSGSPSPYRLSVGYEATVVLIDSGRPAKSAPPVLGRASPGDDGFAASTLAGEPTTEALKFPAGLSGVRTLDQTAPQWLSDELTVAGTNLNHPNLRLVFRHLRLGFGYIATPAPDSAADPTLLRVRLSTLTAFNELPGKTLDATEVPANKVAVTDPTAWPAGVYTVAAARAVWVERKVEQPGGTVVTQEGRLYTTAPLAFGVLPQVDATASPFTVVFTAGPGGPTAAAMTVKLVEPIRPAAQQVRLFAGGLELTGPVASADGITLNWQASDPVGLRDDLEAANSRGERLFLRVQVDGVDSSMLKPPAAGADTPPRAFDPALIVQVA